MEKTDGELKYQITVSEKEASIISHALEFMARVGMGQLEEVQTWSPNKNPEGLHYILKAASMAATGFDSPNAFHSIFSDEVKWQAKLASDLYKVVRHGLAWDENPEGGIEVRFDNPRTLQTFGSDAKMERVEG